MVFFFFFFIRLVFYFRFSFVHKCMHVMYISHYVLIQSMMPVSSATFRCTNFRRWSTESEGNKKVYTKISFCLRLCSREEGKKKTTQKTNECSIQFDVGILFSFISYFSQNIWLLTFEEKKCSALCHVFFSTTVYLHPRTATTTAIKKKECLIFCKKKT